MNIAYVALGANLGDPAATIRAAFGALANLPESRVVHCSSLYRTAPVGNTEQPEFINAVAALETTLAPSHCSMPCSTSKPVLVASAPKNGPRTLDLDLLLYNNQQLNLPRLTLPHPRLHLRAFVLYPLAELAPDLQLPGRGSIAAWLPAVANQGISRL